MNMKYNVIDIMDGMGYAPGDEIIAVVEADSADKAIAVAMHIVGADVMENFDPDGYAEYVLPNRFLMVAAIPVA